MVCAIKRREVKWTSTSCVGNTFYNTVLKERYKGQTDEEEDMSSYWMALREQEDTGS
jgi:hypothetical protein